MDGRCRSSRGDIKRHSEGHWLHSPLAHNNELVSTIALFEHSPKEIGGRNLGHLSSNCGHSNPPALPDNTANNLHFFGADFDRRVGKVLRQKRQPSCPLRGDAFDHQRVAQPNDMYAVAERARSAVDHSTLPYHRMVVTSALLLLEDA